MIELKSAQELLLMREAGKISAGALKAAGAAVRPGISTAAIDRIAKEYIHSCGAKPSFLNLYGFPASACISINDEIIHGIPGSRLVKEGDIVSIDVGACYKGFHGDNAATFAAGPISAQAQRLLDVTKQSLYLGVAAAVKGNRVRDIGAAVQGYVEAQGYSVVRDYIGHGVGRKLHEDPEVPNFKADGPSARLVPGMTIAIEPMVNEGVYDCRVLDNDWTVVTADGKLAAHFEFTVAITDGDPVVLTPWDK